MLNAIEQVNAESIFILPNNKNIVLAANQAKALVEDKNIIVIPTKTIPQGITAIINFMPDADAASNEETMLDEIKNVKSLKPYVCVCIYINIYEYLYSYMYIFLFKYMYIYLHVCINVYLYLFLLQFLCVIKKYHMI